MSNGNVTGTTLDYSGKDGADNSKSVVPNQGDYNPTVAAKGTPNAKDSGKSCGTHAGTGHKGETGLRGHHGTPGGNGTGGGTIKIICQGEASGHFVLTTNGGNGGAASQGGLGGKGQTGGPGGDKSKNCNGGSQGQGGQGGPGGTGGKPGDGGNAGNIYVTYQKTGTPTPSFDGTAKAGVYGSTKGPGGGGPGAGGVPPGGTGVVGDDAPKAKNGNPGNVFINGSKIN